MKRSFRFPVVLALAGLLAAGSAASANAAPTRAAISSTCTSTDSVAPECAAVVSVSGRSTVTVKMTSSPSDEPALVTWGLDCGLKEKTDQSFNATTPVSRTMSLNVPSGCDGVFGVAGGILAGGTIHLSLTAGPAGPAAPEIKGYAHLCVDDAGNSITAGNKIETWSCYGGAAEQWSLRRGEVLHRGMCLTDKSAGGSGSPVVLNKCNGASNELWTHNSHGEYVLKAHGGTLCLDDPAYAKRNGTALAVYTCHDSANQRWSLP